MAKKKMTLEEKLKEAIVNEKPYKIPDNWIWIKSGSLTEVVSGGTPKSTIKEYYENGDISWITPSDLSGYDEVHIARGRRNITKLGLEKSSAKLMPKDSVLMSSRAPIGYVVIAENEMCTNQGFKSFMPSSMYLPKYLFYYLKYSKDLVESLGSGTTFKELSSAKAKLIPITIAPLMEQQRIVDKIESLFEKLDKAKELIEEARDEFENRKVAILEKAFRGELTEQWRADNNFQDCHDRVIEEIEVRNLKYGKVKKKDKPNFMSYDINDVKKDIDLPNNWVKAPVGLLCDCIVPGRDKPKSFTGNIPWITIPNLISDYVDKNSSEMLLSKDEIEKVKAKIIPSNSVVMSCVGRFGISSIVAEECVINQQLHAFLPSNLINPKFLMYHIRILKGYMEKIATSTTIAYINKTGCNSLIISLPTIEEQEKIVELLENLLSDEKQAEELTNLENQIELIKKSILAKAFRGELGTNNPEEESAIELLKEILSEK